MNLMFRTNPHGCAGGDTVIDHYRNAPCDRGARATSKITMPPTFDFGELAFAGVFEFLLADTCYRDHVVVAYNHRLSAIDHCPHGELGLKRHPDLADQDQIERGIEHFGNFGRDGHATPRQREHSHLLAPVFGQGGSEFLSGICAITKRHSKPYLSGDHVI